ncbi:MAG: AraC family transcriptional regulator [Tardiphaga sp.]|nr:AraC family transcriptional regulator [Tardiphaga sp.]
MSHPLQAFEVLHTDRIEVARTALIERYGAKAFEIGNQDPFSVQASFVRLNGMALSYCHYTSAVELKFPEADFVRHHICLSGQIRATQGNAVQEADSDHWSALVESDRDVDYAYAPDTRQLVMWFDNSSLRTKMGALTGRSMGDRIDFRPPPNGQVESLHALRRAISFAVTEIDLAGPSLSPVAIAEIEDMVAARFLHAYAHDQTATMTQPALLPSVKQLRRLEEYLAGHLDQPLNVEAMARISNVSARSVFRYFKEVRGCTPHAFLKGLRLQQARSALLASEPGATVVGVALRCGFSSLGHFARDYRNTFGELPSITLGNVVRD